jgi:hypothetical protein
MNKFHGILRTRNHGNSITIMDLNPTYTELDLDSDFAIECGMTS